jgi:hypothetical protein
LRVEASLVARKKAKGKVPTGTHMLNHSKIIQRVKIGKTLVKWVSNRDEKMLNGVVSVKPNQNKG